MKEIPDRMACGGWFFQETSLEPGLACWCAVSDEKGMQTGDVAPKKFRGKIA